MSMEPKQHTSNIQHVKARHGIIIPMSNTFRTFPGTHDVKRRICTLTVSTRQERNTRSIIIKERNVVTELSGVGSSLVQASKDSEKSVHGLARVVFIAAAMMGFTSAVSHAADDTMFANRGGCIKCIAFSNAQTNVYDGKTVRFQSHQSPAAQIATKSATAQPASAQRVVAAQP